MKKDKVTVKDIVLGFAPIWIPLAAVAVINMIYTFL